MLRGPGSLKTMVRRGRHSTLERGYRPTNATTVRRGTAHGELQLYHQSGVIGLQKHKQDDGKSPVALTAEGGRSIAHVGL